MIDGVRIQVDSPDVEEKYDFPTYTTQFLNIATRNARANDQETLGSMSDLTAHFFETRDDTSYDSWTSYYMNECEGDERIETATDDLMEMVEKMQDAIRDIDREMARDYIERLTLKQTYEGMCIEATVVETVANDIGQPYQITGSSYESDGIDAFIGTTPVSVKPMSYEVKDEIDDDIDVTIIYYEQNESNIDVVYPTSLA